VILQRIAFALAMAFAAVDLASAGNDSTPTIELSVKGDIQIGPDGHVTDCWLKTQMAPSVAKVVDSTVRSWHFEPITVEGRPVNAKTTMNLALRATPAPNDSYSLRIESVHFGTLTQTNLKPPVYPADAVRAGLGARVVLYLIIGENGNVIEVMPGQTSLTMRAKDEHEAEIWRKRFEKASLEAARSWRYDTSELVDGKRVARRYAIAPVDFSISHSDRKWITYVPGPVHPAWWDRNAADSNGEKQFAQLADGETASVSSNFRLKDDVVGKTL
jgi:hypothetical protein